MSPETLQRVRELIFELIVRERERQERLHPDWPDNPFERLAILAEEFGEVGKGVHERDHEDTVKELVEVMAVCCRWLESSWYEEED